MASRLSSRVFDVWWLSIPALTVGACLWPEMAHGTILSAGSFNDNQTSIAYFAETGELALDAPRLLANLLITSQAGVFNGPTPTDVLIGGFDTHTTHEVFMLRDGSGFGSVSFGSIAQARLEKEFLLTDLTVIGTIFPGGEDLGEVDLIYIPVPEPWSLALLALGSLLVVPVGRFRTLPRSC